MLEDFEKVYKNFPILFSFGSKGYPKANILLNDGNSHCPYIEDNKCTIYEQRPSICRTFPLSPSIFDKIYISEECPNVSISEKETNDTIISDGKIKSKSFDKKLFENYSDKFLDTHHYLLKFIEDDAFKPVLQTSDMLFFIYDKQSNDKFINFHKNSLDNLSKFIT